MTSSVRRLLVALSGALLLVGLAACGDSGDATSGASTTSTADGANGDAAGSSPSAEDAGDEATDADPCSLYSVDAMAAQMGVDDVTAEAIAAVSPTCTYTSAAHYLKAELAILDEEQMANTPRDPTAYLTDANASSLELLEVSGIGDEVFGSSSKGGVSMAVRVGDTGYSVLLSNAGGGADSGAWTDEAAMATSAEAILSAVVGA